jgi:hypothetical protein
MKYDCVAGIDGVYVTGRSAKLEPSARADDGTQHPAAAKIAVMISVRLMVRSPARS